MERNASSAVKRGEVGSLRRTVFGLMLVCFCMRSPMSTVGPLVAQMKETLHLSSSFSGMLTTIPLFIFGLTALVSGRFLHKLQVRTWFLLDTALILAGILGRSYLGVPGLLAGTACLGLGIGILNVLTPVWIRQDWAAHLGPVMGAYSASMNAMSGVAAGTAVILSALLGGWQNAMALFALFPAAAILFWAPSREARHPLAVKTAEPLELVCGALHGSAVLHVFQHHSLAFLDFPGARIQRERCRRNGVCVPDVPDPHELLHADLLSEISAAAAGSRGFLRHSVRDGTGAAASHRHPFRADGGHRPHGTRGGAHVQSGDHAHCGEGEK